MECLIQITIIVQFSEIIIFVSLNSNVLKMEQRILTFSRRFTSIDNYSFNLDHATMKLNAEGWNVKQVVSTSFNHSFANTGQSYPVLVITLLVEKG